MHLTEQAHELGVDAFLGRDAVLQQAATARDRRALKAMAAATDKPIVVYNIPAAS